MTARSLHTTLGLDLLPSSVLETPEGGCSKDVQSKQANLYTAQMSDVVHAYPFELSQFRVPGPPEVYYIANFVTREEERYLLRKVRLTCPTQDFGASWLNETIDKRISPAEMETAGQPQVRHA